jgi:acetyl-CoA carboxylase biotin carboxylase subunit
LFKKVLIANRGEIALRIIRACKELGIKSVAIYSEVDRDSLHVRFADERVCVGPADASLSYRNVPNILSAAEITDAEAIHPGYGFLAENAHFAEACESAGIKFIGPSASSIALMGDKAKAREIMSQKGIPVIPGSQGKVASEKEALEIAKKIGYPAIIKAAAGGGGRGLRVVNREEDMLKSLQTAQSEAKSAFGDGGVYIEKYFLEPRHIEVQILADEKGRTVSLGERDCSIQRRHQKVLEESPSLVVDEPLRRELGRMAVEIAKGVGYVNAGTVEFLLDKNHTFYFIEMNTRIQVEHPVTEMVTGIDLIKEQIKIAAARPLEYKQSDIRIRGHSIECRINAECPEKFTPSPGTITRYYPPGGYGVRVDSSAYTDCVIPPHYDSMIAKLIVHGNDREEAIARMRRALEEFIIEGIKTTIPLHKRILEDPGFIKAKISTNFLERLLSNQENN